jgi:hypothetical protein
MIQLRLTSFRGFPSPYAAMSVKEAGLSVPDSMGLTKLNQSLTIFIGLIVVEVVSNDIRCLIAVMTYACIKVAC